MPFRASWSWGDLGGVGCQGGGKVGDLEEEGEGLESEGAERGRAGAAGSALSWRLGL